MLLTAIVAAGTAFAGQVEKKKEITYESPTDAYTVMKIDSRFSDIDLRHWNKDKAEIRAFILVKGKNEKKASEYLEDVKIEINKKGNVICIEDEIPDHNKQKNEDIRITYSILIPAGIPIDLNQQFGTLQLPGDNPSVCTLNIRFGNVTGGNFHSLLTLKSAFSKIKLGNLQNARLDLIHSDKVSIGNGSNVDANLQFTSLETGNIDGIILKTQHGDLKAGTCNRANVNSQFSEIVFGGILNSLEMEHLTHSSLNVKELSSGFSSVHINASFSEARMNLARETAFGLDAVTRFGDIKLNRTFKLLTDPRDTQQEPYTKKFIGPVNGGSKKEIIFEGQHSTLYIDPSR